MSRTALITGATSGLGYEFVKLFAKDGYNLVLVARNEQKMIEIKKSFHDIHVTVICKDLSKSNSAKEVLEEIEKQGMSIDVLVNNAGFGSLGNFSESDIQTQLNMIQLNITTLTELTYYFLVKMRQKKDGGKILNVASTAAFQPGPLMAVYYATKAYVLSFSEALAEELLDSSITVTTLCPGPTKTNFGSIANVEGTKMFSRAMDSEIVAKQGYDALIKGKRTIVTGGLNIAGTIAAKFLPRRIAGKVARSMAEKE